MATLDEIRLQQLLQNFEGPQGIATLNPLAFQYQDQLYPQSNNTMAKNTMSNFQNELYPQSEEMRDAQILMNRPDNVFTNSVEDPAFSIENLAGYDYDPYLGTKDNFNYDYNIGTRPSFLRTNTLPANRLEGLDFSRFQSLPANMGVANEADEDQEFLPDQEPSGIAKLFQLLGKIPTPFNLARRGLESLKGFNQRLRQSDFGQAENLADYLDMRSYGGLRERNSARARNMAQARGIQKGIDRGDFDGPNRGDRDRGSVTEKSAAKSKGVGGGGYTKSDDNRESYRG
jgi:hypothetical protein